MTDASTSADITAVLTNFRLPAFSSVDTNIWFKRAEIQFRLKKITSSTVQADHVLAALLNALNAASKLSITAAAADNDDDEDS